MLELLERPIVDEPPVGIPWDERHPANPPFKPEPSLLKLCPQIASATVVTFDRNGDQYGVETVKACTEEVATLRAYIKASQRRLTDSYNFNFRVYRSLDEVPKRKYPVNLPSSDGTGIMIVPMEMLEERINGCL